MINQVKSEWIKLRSVRSNVVLFILAIVFTALVAGLVTIQRTEDMPVYEAFFGFLIAEILFLVIGIQIIGQEYRFKTIRTTLSATPQRMKVYVAKLITLVLAIFATSILLAVISAGVAQLGLLIQGHSLSFDWETSPRFFLILVLISISISCFGFGIGSIVRQPIAAIVLGIIWALVVENTIAVIFLFIMEIEIGKWLPYGNLISTRDPAYSELGEFSSPFLAILYSGSIFFILIAIGGFLLQKRDA